MARPIILKYNIATGLPVYIVQYIESNGVIFDY